MDTGTVIKWGLIVIAAYVAWGWLSSFTNEQLAGVQMEEAAQSYYTRRQLLTAGSAVNWNYWQPQHLGPFHPRPRPIGPIRGRR
jgi:hypothetical protein